MSYIDHHASLETLAGHLVEDDCEHIATEYGIDSGGHCYDCTLAHLKKEFERRPTSISTSDTPS